MAEPTTGNGQPFTCPHCGETTDVAGSTPVRRRTKAVTGVPPVSEHPPDDPAEHEGYWWPRDGKWMGKADWCWIEDLGIHMPCCRSGNGYGQTCGNGPLSGDQIETGDCGEHE